VTILSAASGEPLKRFAVESEVELPIELNDNEVIFNTGNNWDHITVLNLDNGEVLPVLEGTETQAFVLNEGGSYRYALNSDETLLLLGTSNGQLYMWDIQTEEVVAVIQAHDLPITHVLMSYTYMISVSNDEQRIRLWQLGAS
jgi:WD40 repeat protein